MARPVEETNEPLPPELKRTLDFCRCSSHCRVGSNSGCSFNRWSGGLLNSHIPSSPNARSLRPPSKIKQRRARILNIPQHSRARRRNKHRASLPLALVIVIESDIKQEHEREHDYQTSLKLWLGR